MEKAENQKVNWTSARKALQVLHDLGSRLWQDSPSADLAQNAVEILEEGMGFELLAVLVVARPEEGLRPLALSRQGHDRSFLETDLAYVGEQARDTTGGITNWVAGNGESVRIGHVADDPRYRGLRDGIRSELCVPLRAGGEIIGVLNTETTRRDAYTAADEQFLETAASHIALALKLSSQQAAARAHPVQQETGSPLLAACSYCKSIQVEKDKWVPPESFLLHKYGLILSHRVCPHCYEQMKESGFGN
jgi:GAF domain-containing protein